MARRISPTRLKLYNECARKYWYDEVKGLSETRVWHAFGTYAHAIAEQLLRGETPELNPKTDALVKQFPSLDTAYASDVGHAFAALTRDVCEPIAVEQDLYVTGPNGAGWYDCTIDCIGRAPNGTLVVVDHKTSGDPYKYAKPEETLKADLQCQLYAFAAMLYYAESEVLCHWHWLPRKRCAWPESKAITTEVRYTREELEPIATQACEQGQELLALKERPMSWWEVDKWQAQDICNRWGGCPHKTRCKMEKGETTMGFNFKDLVPMESTEPEPAPVNPEPEAAPVTATTAAIDECTPALEKLAESEVSKLVFLKAQLSLDIETAKDKGYDLETYLRMTYGI